MHFGLDPWEISLGRWWKGNLVLGNFPYGGYLSDKSWHLNEASPYKKPNNVINYVHKKSNHPPTILKNIPANINRRLSSISSSKEIFDAAVPPYQEALDKAGYDYKLEFNEVEPNQQRNSRRKRKRDIIFF